MDVSSKPEANFTRALPFTELDFLHIPFRPNESNPEAYLSEQLETNVVYLKRRAGGPLRLSQDPEKSWQRYFCDSRIVALDISTWVSVSRLAPLQTLFERYPMFLVDATSELTDEALLPLIRYLRKKSYILPVFPYQRQNGLWQVPVTYSLSALGLLQGNLRSADLSTLRGPRAPHDDAAFEAMLLRDFPDFVRGAEAGTYVVESTQFSDRWTGVRWLGPSREVEKGIGRIYDSSEECLTFAVLYEYFEQAHDAVEEFLRFAKHSLFFFVDEEQQIVRPRLLRNKVHLKIASSCGAEMQERLVKTGAISTTRTISDEDFHFADYHSFGKLEDKDPEYTRKLLHLAHTECKVLPPYNKVLFYDDGSFGNLPAYIEECLHCPVVRAVHSGSEMRLYPFHEILPGDRVLVLCDVINTGAHTKSMIRLVEGYRAEAAGVFAFVANLDLAPLRFETASSKEVSSVALFYRRLPAPVAMLRPEIKGFRKWTAGEQRYLFFWEMIDKIGGVKARTYTSRPLKLLLPHDEVMDVSREFCHVVLLKDVNKGVYFNDLLALLRDRVNSFGNYKAILANSATSAARMADRIKEHFGVPGSVETIRFRTIEAKALSLQPPGRILVLDDGINTFHNLRRTLDCISERGFGKDDVDAVVLFKRKPMPDAFLPAILREERVCKSLSWLLVYYESSIPFYLAPTDDSDLPDWVASPLRWTVKELNLLKDRWPVNSTLWNAAEEMLKTLPQKARFEQELGEEEV